MVWGRLHPVAEKYREFPSWNLNFLPGSANFRPRKFVRSFEVGDSLSFSWWMCPWVTMGLTSEQRCSWRLFRRCWKFLYMRITATALILVIPSVDLFIILVFVGLVNYSVYGFANYRVWCFSSRQPMYRHIPWLKLGPTTVSLILKKSIGILPWNRINYFSGNK